MTVKRTKLYFLKIAFIVMMVVLVLAGYLYIDGRITSKQLLSLEDALWTCDAAMQNFYPPASPQSDAVITGLASTGLDVKTKQYRHLLCLRILSPDALPDALAIWEPFDPENPTSFIDAQR